MDRRPPRTAGVRSPRVLRRTLDDTFAEAIRRDITTVTTARLCANALFRYIGPFLAVVADGLDVSVAELGIALTVAQVCGFAAPAIGRLVDHLPRRRSIAIGLAGCAIGGLVVAVCSGIIWFTVGLMTISTFNIVLVVGTGTWIADHVPFAQRSRVVGLNEMSWALGLLVGVSAMGLVTAATSWRWAYASAAVVAGAVVVVLLTRLDDDATPSNARTPPTTAGGDTASVWSRVPSTGWLAIVGVIALTAGQRITLRDVRTVVARRVRRQRCRSGGDDVRPRRRRAGGIGTVDDAHRSMGQGTQRDRGQHGDGRCRVWRS